MTPELKNPNILDVLIDIAISEKKTADVLKWFEIYKKKRNSFGDHVKDDVATAIVQEYPG